MMKQQFFSIKHLCKIRVCLMQGCASCASKYGTLSCYRQKQIDFYIYLYHHHSTSNLFLSNNHLLHWSISLALIPIPPSHTFASQSHYMDRNDALKIYISFILSHNMHTHTLPPGYRLVFSPYISSWGSQRWSQSWVYQNVWWHAAQWRERCLCWTGSICQSCTAHKNK